MDTFLQDVRYALRLLFKNPALSLLAILTLGIGANSAIFRVVNAILLRPLAFRDPSRLVIVAGKSRYPTISTSFENYSDWRGQSRSFESMEATRTPGVTLTGYSDYKRFNVEPLSTVSKPKDADTGLQKPWLRGRWYSINVAPSVSMCPRFQEMPRVKSVLTIMIAAFLFFVAYGPAATASRAQSQPPAPLRVAVVGLVHGHASGFFQHYLHRPDLEIVGVTEPRRDLFDQYAKQFNLAASLYHADLEEMLTSVHPQAVLAYTNTLDHRRVVDICARHAVPVMMEKPLA